MSLIWDITLQGCATYFNLCFSVNAKNSESNLDQQNISVLVFYPSHKVDDKRDSSVFTGLIIKKVAEKAEQRNGWIKGWTIYLKHH